MANRLALAAALLLALVAIASATTITTVITTNYDDEARTQRHEKCGQQLQGRQFRPCQRFLEQRSSGHNEEEVIEMSTGVQHHEQHLQECCQQLKEMDHHQCGCEAIKHAVKQAQQGSGGGRYQTGQIQSERMYEQARALPRMCGLSEQQCRFRLVFV